MKTKIFGNFSKKSCDCHSVISLSLTVSHRMITKWLVLGADNRCDYCGVDVITVMLIWCKCLVEVRDKVEWWPVPATYHRTMTMGSASLQGHNTQRECLTYRRAALDAIQQNTMPWQQQTFRLWGGSRCRNCTGEHTWHSHRWILWHNCIYRSSPGSVQLVIVSLVRHQHKCLHKLY